VRHQQQEAGDRQAAVPDRGAIDAVEPLLNPRQRADQDQADRQKQDRLGTQQLPDVAPGRLTCRSRHDPQDHLGDRERRDRRRPDVSRDER